MITWNNLDTLESFKELSKVGRVDIKEAMSGDNGAKRVKEYNIPMAEGFTYNFAAKQVDADVLEALANLAKEAQLTEKFEALYNGAVINTGENRLVLHQLTRGQLGDAVVADGVDKRKFYVEQQERIAEFANKVHSGEITNAAGEKFTTVVQIGIGGSDLGPRAMYLALENWAKKNNTFKMEAKFISNVDPDDAASVLASVDVAHSIFILVSKSGTTLETLTNESFVKDALKNAGLDASKHMIAVTSETSRLQRAMITLQPSSWTTTSEDVTHQHQQLVEQFSHLHSVLKYLHSSSTEQQQRISFQRMRTSWKTLRCSTHSSVFTRETYSDILAQQCFHIHRHSAVSLHIYSRLIWSQTASRLTVSVSL